MKTHELKAGGDNEAKEEGHQNHASNRNMKLVF